MIRLFNSARAGLEVPGTIMPSSLIQQDFGEDPHDHGYVVWDIEKREHELHRLETDYGFYTFKVDSIDVIELENERLS